jgi:hypothetical protein
MFKDNSDPVLFASPELENANMTVLHCREVMERTGMTEEATRLTGLEVTDRGPGRSRDAELDEDASRGGVRPADRCHVDPARSPFLIPPPPGRPWPRSSTAQEVPPGSE